MDVDYHLTFLQLRGKGKTKGLIAGHLGDGIPEENELVVWLARILAFVVSRDVSHRGRRLKMNPEQGFLDLGNVCASSVVDIPRH